MTRRPASPLEEISNLALRVKVAQAKADRLRDELVAAVQVAHGAGISQAALARAAGLSRQRIGQRVRRDGA